MHPGTAQPIAKCADHEGEALAVLQVAHGYRRRILLWFLQRLGELIVERWYEDPDGWAPLL